MKYKYDIIKEIKNDGTCSYSVRVRSKFWMIIPISWYIMHTEYGEIMRSVITDFKTIEEAQDAIDKDIAERKSHAGAITKTTRVVHTIEREI